VREAQKPGLVPTPTFFSIRQPQRYPWMAFLPSIVSMAVVLILVTHFVGQRHFPVIVSMAPAQNPVPSCVEQRGLLDVCAAERGLV
jgi:hypothetical protein